MFNVGGGELLVIFLVALIVLGPAKLPEVARQVGGAVREIRKISSGFQAEMRAAMDDPVEAAARDRGQRVVSSEQRPAPATRTDTSVAGDTSPGDDVPEPISTAEAAGMYAARATVEPVTRAADEIAGPAAPVGDADDTGDIDGSPAEGTGSGDDAADDGRGDRR